jgi:hypothetical protein
MTTKSKIEVTIIFPNKDTFKKIYKVECESSPLQAGRMYAHYIIRKTYEKMHPNASYSNFLDYCGDCTVYVTKVL